MDIGISRPESPGNAGPDEYVQFDNWRARTAEKIETFVYKGRLLKVTGISIRWLSECGDDGTGWPDYGLRLFTAEPGGEIPIHSHFYHQTMYILSGRFECWEFDRATDELVRKKICGPGDFIYVPSTVPHGMRNTSDTEEATFLCCIGNVYDHAAPGSLQECV
ncbi:MAG: cupin domain-containing protein [Desulfomonilaceae bacterium]